MNVYKVGLDYDNYAGVFAETPNEVRQSAIQPLGQRFGSTWSPPRYRFSKPTDEGYSGTKPQGDFIGVDLSRIGLPPRTLAAARHLFEPYGELLPLNVDGDLNRVHWFHCTTIIDALDEQRCKLERFADGVRVMGIDSYAFFAERLREAILFKVPQARGYLFCTDTFKRQIEDLRPGDIGRAD